MDRMDVEERAVRLPEAMAARVGKGELPRVIDLAHPDDFVRAVTG